MTNELHAVRSAITATAELLVIDERDGERSWRQKNNVPAVKLLINSPGFY